MNNLTGRHLARNTLVFLAFIASLAGVNGQFTVDSPLNITYSTSNVDIEVSSTALIEDRWFYSLDGGTNTTFTPNITLSLNNGPHNITIFLNFSDQNQSAFGAGFFGRGFFGFSEPNYTINASEIVRFTVSVALPGVDFGDESAFLAARVVPRATVSEDFSLVFFIVFVNISIVLIIFAFFKKRRKRDKDES